MSSYPDDPDRCCEICGENATISLGDPGNGIPARHFCDEHAAARLRASIPGWESVSGFNTPIQGGWFGRAVFGLLALIAAVAFGGFAGMVIWFIGGPPAGVVIWKQIVWHLVVDALVVASLFMLLVALSTFRIGGEFIGSLVRRMTFNGAIAVLSFVAFIVITAGN